MDRSNFDLRRLLAGTENILNGLLERLQETSCGGDFLFQAVSGALQVVPFLAATEQSAKRLDNSASAHGQMIETLRDECTKALRPRKSHEVSIAVSLHCTQDASDIAFILTRAYYMHYWYHTPL